MSIEIGNTTEVENRAILYKLLSFVYRYPTPELFESYQSGAFQSLFRESVSKLAYAKDMIEEDSETYQDSEGMKGVSFQEFETGFIQTFDVGVPEPPCPPYEGVYREEIERAKLMIEVSEFYKYFGLKTSEEEGLKDLPDHLSAELEFMHFLTFKEAQAREEENLDLLKGYILAQKDFLELHLVPWVPAFAEKLRSSAKFPIHSDLAASTAQFLAKDHQWLNFQLEALS